MNDAMRNFLPTWIAALRQPNRLQTTHNLETISQQGTKFQCCLGVLCEIYPGTTREPAMFRDLTQYVFANTADTGLLPPGLADHLGIHNDPELHSNDDTGYALIRKNHRTTLTYLNDGLNFNFNQIADVLQGVLDGHIDLT